MTGIDGRGKSPVTELAIGPSEGAEASRSSGRPGAAEGRQSFSSVVDQLRSEHQESRASSSRTAPGSADVFRDMSTFSARQILAHELQREAGGSRRPFLSREEASSSRFDRFLLREHPERSQTESRPAGGRSIADRGGRTERRRMQTVHGAGAERSDVESSSASRREASSVRSGASPSPEIEGPKARHWTHCSGIAIPCPAWMPNYESGAGSMWRPTKAQVRSDLRSAIMGRHIVKPESHALMANPSSATKMPGTRRERRLRPMQNPSPA